VKFYCIADEDTVRGFRLAGIAGQVAATAPEATLAIEAAAARADVTIIILTEKIAGGIRDQVDAMRLARNRPLIVEVPGPEGPVTGRKTLREFVQAAVGIRVG
jgi:V/A-type H+/Na+-transporting ATPase subunit F